MRAGGGLPDETRARIRRFGRWGGLAFIALSVSQAFWMGDEYPLWMGLVAGLILGLGGYLIIRYWFVFIITAGLGAHRAMERQQRQDRR